MTHLQQQVERQLGKFLRQQPHLGRGVYLARGAVVVGDVTLGDHSSVYLLFEALAQPW